MNDAMVWLLRTALIGGGLLLVGWALARRQRLPARRQRLGELALAAALLVPVLALLPGWLPLAVLAPEPVRQDDVMETGAEAMDLRLPDEKEVFAPLAPEPTSESEAAAPAAQRWQWWELLLGAYALIAGALLARWLLASFLVHRVLRTASPAGPELQALFDQLRRGRRWRLLVSDRVAVPFSVGLLRPTVVLPARLAEAATSEELEWALRHELTHLARQDTRTCWLVALGQVVFFFVPWFWWLRRQVRLAQEMVADAAAAPEGLDADYAQFLLSWAIRPPVTATGVSGSSGSDLYRRIAMLLQNKSAGAARPTRGWLLGVGTGLVALAVIAAGARFQAAAADEAPPAKAEDKKAEPKKEAPKKALPGLDGLKELEKALDGIGAGLDEKTKKDLQDRLAEARKRMEEMMKRMPNGQNLPGGVWVFPGGMGGMGGMGGRVTSVQEARLGAQLAVPSKTLIEQLDLPKNQGMVLEEVGANSAAAKAGLKKHDILLELHGKAVPNDRAKLRKLLEGVKPNVAGDVLVLRKGKKETLKGLSLPEARAQGRPGIGAFPMLPRVPNIPAIPNFPGLPNIQGDSITMSRSNDQFTTTQRKGKLSLTVKGKVVQGKAEVSSVTVDDGTGAKTYDSLDKVPAEHKDQARKLADMSAAGRVNIKR